MTRERAQRLADALADRLPETGARSVELVEEVQVSDTGERSIVAVVDFAPEVTLFGMGGIGHLLETLIGCRVDTIPLEPGAVAASSVNANEASHVA